LQEMPILYRRYVTLHSLATIAAFSVAAVWIIVSATRHSVAQNRCITDFFNGSTNSSGSALCNIFPWVDIGIMSILWIFFAATQVRYSRAVDTLKKSNMTQLVLFLSRSLHLWDGSTAGS